MIPHRGVVRIRYTARVHRDGVRVRWMVRNLGCRGLAARGMRREKYFSPVVWRVFRCRGCDLRYKHLTRHAPGVGFRLFVLEVEIYLADHPVSLILILCLFGDVFLFLLAKETVGDEGHGGTTADIKAVGAAGTDFAAAAFLPPSMDVTP